LKIDMTRLSYHCKSCGKKNYIKSKANDRFELQQELGDELKRNCSICGTYKVTHINRLRAEFGHWVYPVVVLIFLIAVALVLFLGWLAMIAFSAPIWFYFDNQRRVSLFNRVMVFRK